MSIKDALKSLGSNAWDQSVIAAPDSGTGSEQNIEIHLIDTDPTQPRKKFDADKLEELASSIREHGLQQPVGLRANPDKPGRYILTFGERRLRAVKSIGWVTIPAIVREGGNSAAVALIENLQREGLTPLETANALAAYAESHNKKSTQVAADIGKHNSYVSEHLAIRRMPLEFQQAAEAGTVNDVRTLNDAYALHKDYPAEAIKLVISASQDAPLTREKVRQASAKLRGEDARPKAGKAKASPTQEPDNENADGAAVAATGITALPLIYVGYDDGVEIGYLDLGRETGPGGVHVVRDAAGLTTHESFDALRILRIERPAS